MGVLTRLFGGEIEERGFSSAAMERILLGAPSSKSGVSVSVDGSLSNSAVWACVRVLAESMAQLPLILYRRDGAGKRRATEHPLYTLLHDAPNPEMTAFELREVMAGHVATWGNGYAEIEWSDRGYPVALWPLRPDRMTVKRRDGVLFYAYRLPGNEQSKRLESHQVWHWRGMGGDGMVGYSPVRMHMEAIGLSLATERYGAAFFGNGARPGGILTHPGKLSKEAQTRLSDSFEDDHGGIEQAHRMRILEEGMSYTAIGVPPEEAQFLETRKFQIAEIARIYRVPLHMVGDLERATFSNIEHQSINFVVHTLGPWLARIEQTIGRDLLVGQERNTHYAEHLVEGLLRGDTASRYGAYQQAIQSGWMNRNEARVKENLDPAKGLDGFLVPLNMSKEARHNPDIPILEDGPPATRSLDDVVKERQRLAARQSPLIEDVAGRVVRREVADVRRAVQKYLVRGDDLAGFLLWLSDFYEKHSDFVGSQMGATFTALARAVLDSVADELNDADLAEQEADLLIAVDEYVSILGIRWSAASRGQIEKILSDAPKDERADQVLERLDGWADTQPGKVGRREAVRAIAAFSVVAYGLGGVERKRWVASGENCPYCDDLNGAVVGIEGRFVEGGASLNPAGADGPLKVRRNTLHPPLHDGCNCVVVAD
jgi:HK97 family phage portal protein